MSRSDSHHAGRVIISTGARRCGYCNQYVTCIEQALADYEWSARQAIWDAREGHRCLTDAQKQARDDEGYRAYLIARYGTRITRPTVEVWALVLLALAARYNARTTPPAYVALIAPATYAAVQRAAARTARAATAAGPSSAPVAPAPSPEVSDASAAVHRPRPGRLALAGARTAGPGLGAAAAARGPGRAGQPGTAPRGPGRRSQRPAVVGPAGRAGGPGPDWHGQQVRPARTAPAPVTSPVGERCGLDPAPSDVDRARADFLGALAAFEMRLRRARARTPRTLAERAQEAVGEAYRALRGLDPAGQLPAQVEARHRACVLWVHPSRLA